jgi:hypothetical protein
MFCCVVLFKLRYTLADSPPHVLLAWMDAQGGSLQNKRNDFLFGTVAYVVVLQVS